VGLHHLHNYNFAIVGTPMGDSQHTFKELGFKNSENIHESRRMAASKAKEFIFLFLRTLRQGTVRHKARVCLSLLRHIYSYFVGNIRRRRHFCSRRDLSEISALQHSVASCLTGRVLVLPFLLSGHYRCWQTVPWLGQLVPSADRGGPISVAT